MKAGFALCLFAATVALSGTVFGQTTVKVRGATTLEKIIKAKQADIRLANITGCYCITTGTDYLKTSLIQHHG